jgi:alcohol dehydrogenase class IV
MLNLRLPLPRFLSAGEIVVGPGSVGALRALDAVRVLVLASPGLLRAPGAAADLERAIRAEAIRFVAMPTGEPSVERLAPVLAEAGGFGPDWIVAVGGGSVLDGAKLVWIFHEHPEATIERLSRPFALGRMRGRARFVALPTTAGTGSEVSSAAVFSDAATGAKRAIVSHELLPDLAILDPRFSVGVPADVVADAGFDALAHALEGYVSRLDNPFVDVFAESAAEVLLRSLAATQRDPGDLRLRLEVMQAALLAGWVQNLKVPGIGHAVAHQLGRLGIPHGRAVGCLLPGTLRFNQADPAVAARYDRVARRCGLRDGTELVQAVETLGVRVGLRPMGLPPRSQIQPELPAIAAAALNDPCARTNPRPVTVAAVADLLLPLAPDSLAPLLPATPPG